MKIICFKGIIFFNTYFSQIYCLYGGGIFFFFVKGITFLNFHSLESFNKSCLEMPQNNPLSQNGQNRGFPWQTLLEKNISYIRLFFSMEKVLNKK